MTEWRTVVLAVVATVAAAPAAAQQVAARTVPLVRVDAHGTLGWFNAEAPGPNRYDDWYNRSLFAGAGAGWYWTDHLKTEVEIGATTEAELYSAEPVILSGRPLHVAFITRFRTTRLGIAQHYQFFRNAWFHPHLGAGVDVRWVTTERRDEPVYDYDPVTRQPRLIRERVHLPAATTRDVRPFAAAGFKAYMTQRGFFRSDVRFGLGEGVDEVVLRFGFGVDF